MRLSAFNLYVEGFPDPGATLIHNTLSGAYVVVEHSALAALRKLDRGQALSAAERERLDLDAWGDPDVGVVVHSLDAEEREYREWFARFRSRPALRAIVGVNLACNFACPYCCQAEIMDGSVMKPDIAARTADWLAERALAIEVDRAHITFVGGEPLLHPDRIKSLAARMMSRLDRDGVELSIGLITNGYFLSEEMVRELLPYGLTCAQVTLDGDDTTHHLSRVCKSGEDTFPRVFDNVLAASRSIRITLAGNYQEHTVRGFGPLIDLLATAGMPAGTKLRFTPALEVLAAPEGSVAGACSWSRASYAYQVALHDKILSSGFSTNRLHTVGPCAFFDGNFFAIDPAGNLFQCPGFLGQGEWRIGHVADGLDERYEAMLSFDATASCQGCAHRPNCNGGCVADTILRTGHMGINCERDYLDEIAPHALPREYLLCASPDRASALAGFPEPPAALPPARSTRGVRSQALRVL